MPMKSYRPLTPVHYVTKQRTPLSKSLLIRHISHLTEIKAKINGRNNRGVITVRHRGGGHKKFYRIIDFKRNKFDIPGIIETIEYDPNRTCFIALVRYIDGERRYILASTNMKVGHEDYFW